MKNVTLPIELADFLVFLDDGEAGRLLISIMNYANDGELNGFEMGRKELSVFNRLRKDIDRQRDIYERKVNVCRGAKAKQDEWVAEGKKSAAIRENKKRTLLGK